jgi:hypothetical protein
MVKTPFDYAVEIVDFAGGNPLVAIRLLTQQRHIYPMPDAYVLQVITEIANMQYAEDALPYNYERDGF